MVVGCGVAMGSLLSCRGSPGKTDDSSITPRDAADPTRSVADEQLSAHAIVRAKLDDLNRIEASGLTAPSVVHVDPT
jgi:hypothetical protein